MMIMKIKRNANTQTMIIMIIINTILMLIAAVKEKANLSIVAARNLISIPKIIKG